MCHWLSYSTFMSSLSLKGNQWYLLYKNIVKIKWGHIYGNFRAPGLRECMSLMIRWTWIYTWPVRSWVIIGSNSSLPMSRNYTSMSFDMWFSDVSSYGWSEFPCLLMSGLAIGIALTVEVLVEMSRLWKATCVSTLCLTLLHLHEESVCSG